MGLPDPHDVDYQRCLDAYKDARAACLRRIERHLTTLDQYEERCIEFEQRGGATPEEAVEMSDRLSVLVLQRQTEVHVLIGLRIYIDICRAVHGLIDRGTYETIRAMGAMGISPVLARKLLAEGATLSPDGALTS